MARKKKAFSVQRSPGFEKLYATNIIANHTDVDFRIEVLNEVWEREEEGDVYVSDGMVVLTPEAAKKLNKRLSKEIKKFEEETGEKIMVSKKRGKI